MNDFRLFVETVDIRERVAVKFWTLLNLPNLGQEPLSERA